MIRRATVTRIRTLLFGLALIALAALVTHWIWLIWHDENRTLDADRHTLEQSARREAARLGRADPPPHPGPLPWHRDLEVLSIPAGQAEQIPKHARRLLPLHPHLALRPRPAQIAAIRARKHRRMIMIVGEGSLAFLLFAILVAMLLRTLLVERNRRREIEAFISTVSHELKTPLAGIRALLGTLQLGHLPKDRLSEFLDMGLRETDRLEHLVENLLLANRIRTRLLRTQIEPVDLGAFLEAFARHRKPLVPDGHPGLQVDLDPARGIWIRADPDKLHVVLDNLADNAIKYGESTTVRVTVRLTNSQVSVDVEDRGVGFSEDEADEIFEGVRASPRAGGALVHGTGLGLGIARDLIVAMGGRITAYSAGPGQGSRFSVHLLRTTAGDDPAPSDPSESPK